MGLLLLSLCGCAGFWDEITSRDFKMKELFVKPDPLTVLRDSSDGAKRGVALSQLREPLQNGGNQEQQDIYLKILTEAATSSPEPLCRLGAIRALGTFKDPRAAEALENVYFEKLKFTGETNSVVRMQALSSLEQTGNPDAAKLFLRVAGGAKFDVKSALADRQETNDERLAAVRALARYRDADSVEVLVKILGDEEEDVALRDRAHQSLVIITGKNLPPDATAWRNLIQDNPGNGIVRQPPSMWRKMTGLVGN